MRSILTLLGVSGAIACDPGACDVDPDGSSLLQAKSMVRKHKRTGATDAKEILHSLRNVANSLTEGSDVSMTPEDVNDAVGTAREALETMFPAFADQHRLAQQELEDAIRSVEACEEEHGGELRARLEAQVATHFAAKEECDEALGAAMQAEVAACEGQGSNPDCACNEAREAVAAQTALCDSVTSTYELSFCEHELACDTLHGCHEREVAIYADIRADVEAAMLLRQQEYITARQADCLMELIMGAMLSGTPISHAALIACDDVNVDALMLEFPSVPAAPADCPEPQSDDPQCDAGGAPATCTWALPSEWGIQATSHWDGNYQPDNVKAHGGNPWHSGRANSLPQDLIFDAGEAVTLSGFATAHPTGWAGSAMQAYTFSASNDGVDYSEVVSGTGINLGNGQRQEIDFEPVSARYWKMHMTSNHGYGNYLTDQYIEFRFCRRCVSGFDWALPGDWSITATSHWDGNYQPNNVKVHEGRPWHTGRANTLPQDLFFDAGQEVTLNGFATAHPTGWAGSAMQAYAFSRSDDGVHYSEVVSGTGTNLGHGQRQEIEFDSVSSRYWRLHVTSNYGYGNYVTAQYVEFRAHSDCSAGASIWATGSGPR